MTKQQERDLATILTDAYFEEPEILITTSHDNKNDNKNYDNDPNIVRLPLYVIEKRYQLLYSKNLGIYYVYSMDGLRSLIMELYAIYYNSSTNNVNSHKEPQLKSYLNNCDTLLTNLTNTIVNIIFYGYFTEIKDTINKILTLLESTDIVVFNDQDIYLNNITSKQIFLLFNKC